MPGLVHTLWLNALDLTFLTTGTVYGQLRESNIYACRIFFRRVEYTQTQSRILELVSLYFVYFSHTTFVRPRKSCKRNGQKVTNQLSPNQLTASSVIRTRVLALFFFKWLTRRVHWIHACVIKSGSYAYKNSDGMLTRTTRSCLSFVLTAFDKEPCKNLSAWRITLQVIFYGAISRMWAIFSHVMKLTA